MDLADILLGLLCWTALACLLGLILGHCIDRGQR